MGPSLHDQAKDLANAVTSLLAQTEPGTLEYKELVCVAEYLGWVTEKLKRI